MKTKREQQEKSVELIRTFVERAQESASFKDQLVKNPTAAIEEFTGQSLVIPAGKTIVVEDQTNESIIYLNLPAEPDFNELELTEEQLEMIAGGISPTLIAVGYGFMAGVAFIGAAAGVAAVMKD